jgi:hypothetical protein
VLVSPRDGLLLRQEPDGSLVTHADLTGISQPPPRNEVVADGRGNIHANGGGFDLIAGEKFTPASSPWPPLTVPPDWSQMTSRSPMACS